MKDFEVIVVGAGPAGAMITKELAKRKISVACIEREIEAGYPSKSTAGTPLDTFEVFDIPENLGYEGVSGLRVFGPSQSYVHESPTVFGRLFQFRELKQHLIKEAIRLGAAVMLGTTVTDILQEDGKIVGISYEGFEGKGTIRANVIVDATGPEAIFAAKLGLMPKHELHENPRSLDYFTKPGVGGGFEYFMENVKPDKGQNGFFLDLFLGTEYTPGGYSWIFPTSDHEAKAGACKMNPDFTVQNEKSQKEYFQKLWNENPQLKDAQPFEVHMCPYRHWIIGGLKTATLDNFIAIGDAATKFQPVFGEGVRASFYSAHFAADAIEEATKKKDYSQKVLGLYDKLWDEKWGRNWELSTMAYKILYSSTDAELDTLIKALPKLNFESLWNLYLGKGSIKDKIAVGAQLTGVLNTNTLSMLIKALKG